MRYFIPILLLLLIACKSREEKRNNFQVNLSDGTVLSTNLDSVQTPTGLPISKEHDCGHDVNIAITSEQEYQIKNQQYDLVSLENELTKLKNAKQKTCLIVTINKDVPMQYLVDLATIAGTLDLKILVSAR